MKHLRSLDLIRVIAFLEVFTCHCLWGGGSLGVSLFLVLSGFLLTYNYYKCPQGGDTLNIFGSIRYAYNKLLPLYPLHIGMMLAAFLFSVYMGRAASVPIKQFLLGATMIQAGSINGVAWYLSVCLFTYFCFPYILWLIRKYKNRYTAVLAIFLIFLIQSIIGIMIEYGKLDLSMYAVTYRSPFYRLGDFMIGCNLGYLFLTRKEGNVPARWICTSVECIALILLFGMWYNSVYSVIVPYYGLFYSAMFEPVSCFAIYVFAIGAGSISALAELRIVRFLAKMSPYAYLIHYLVIRILMEASPLKNTVDTWHGKWTIAIIAMTVSLLLSYLYDKHIVQYLKQKKAKVYYTSKR